MTIAERERFVEAKEALMDNCSNVATELLASCQKTMQQLPDTHL